MTLRQTPTLRIGSQVIPCDFPTSGPQVIALAGLELVWGRPDLYTRTEPATLRIDLVDRDGIWSAAPERIGEEIVLTLPGGRILYRGKIVEISLTLGEFEGGSAWFVTVDATDVLADLARAPMGYPDPQYPTVKERPVPLVATAVATQAIRTAQSLGVASVQNSAWFAAQTGFRFQGAAIDDQPSVLDMLYETWIVEPFVTVAWDPQTRVIYAHPALDVSDAMFALGYVDDTLDIIVSTPGSADEQPVNVQACMFEVDGDVTIRSTVQSAISTVSFEFEYQVYEYQPRNQGTNGITVWVAEGKRDRYTVEFPVIDNPKTAATVHHPTRIYNNTAKPGNVVQATKPAEPPPEVTDPVPFRQTIGPGWVDAIRKLNGRLIPDEVIYRLEDWPADEVREAMLLAVYPPKRAFMLWGAAYAHLPNATPLVQLIGATLTFDRDGWVIRGVLAPALGGVAAGGGVTIAELVTNPTPGFDDYAPTLTLADLATVSKGYA